MRLFTKFLISYLVVVIVGVVVVSYLANQVATREVQSFMFQGGMTTEAGLAQKLAAYYRGHGSWEGVQALLLEDNSMGAMMGQRLLVADATGQVISDTSQEQIGQRLSDTQLAEGNAITVGGQQVGTLLAQGGTGMGGMTGGMGLNENAASNLSARVNRAIWLAALAAGGAALIVGGLLAYGLVRPVQRLTAAARAVAQGDLSHRVLATSNDEIGDLATAFNAMAADLGKAERLRRDMVADLAHELRNPLAALQGTLEAIADGILPPTEENLHPLLDQTQLLTRLVNDLRTLALADAGQLSLNRAPTDPVELVRSVIAQFSSQASAKHIRLEAEFGNDIPSLALDSQRITQVLGNLISNAIRHTPEGGQIECQVTASLTPVPEAIVSVSDTGSGIPPEALPHIFDRFFRADRSRSRTDGGTGLGLAIAKQLVEAHNGRIWATSQPGQGTQVTFTLPVS